MADKLMIMGVGPDPARLAVAIHLLQTLPGPGKKVAYYKPVIAAYKSKKAGGDITRTAIRLFAPQALSGKYYTTCEGVPLMARKEVIDAVVARYEELTRRNDWVIIQGTDYTPAPNAFEGDFNLEIAENTGAPVLLVLKVSGGQQAEAIAKACDVAGRLAHRKIPLAGIIVHGVKGAPAAFTRELKVCLGEGVYCAALPELDITDFSVESDGIEQMLQALAKVIDSKAVIESLHQYPPVLTGSLFRSRLLRAVRGYRVRIVLPEGEDARTLQAATRFISVCHSRLILLGNPVKISSVIKKEKINLATGNISIIDPGAPSAVAEFAKLLYRLRKNKGMTMNKAQGLVHEPCWLGCLMVKQNLADAMVAGAVYTTPQIARPALQLIRAKKDKPLVSSVFFMCLPHQVLVFADCAINPDPSAEQLAEIALSSAETSFAFGIEPRVAMISYSTAQSGAGATVEKVRLATSIVKQRAPKLLIEGPMQYDAAVEPAIAHAKWPGSAVAGRATVFVFPDLNTGNTVYKAVQQAFGAVAIGPVLQGLNKPVNDLSRGGTTDDIFYTLLATVLQCRINSGRKNHKADK